MNYTYSKMNEMHEILNSLEMPKSLKNTRSILTLLAIGKLSETSRWRSVKEDYSRPHDIIVFINDNYPLKGGTDQGKGDYKENTRESFRKGSIQPFCELAILESNDEVTNSGNTAYRYTKEFAKLIRSYGSDEWNDNLEYYKDSHISYAEKYNQKKHLDKGLSVTFMGEQFTLVRNPHNKLQKSFLEEWVPVFAPGAQLLYIGDTKKKNIKMDTEKLSQLKVRIIDNAKLPDIILYEENSTHKWLLIIEAYTSTGEITIERKKKILEYCEECPNDVEIIFVTAFSTMRKCKEKFLSIAWDTEIWVAEEPTHMVHKNGDRFLSGHAKNE